MTPFTRFGSALVLAFTLIGAPIAAQAQTTPAAPATTTPLPQLVGRQVKIVHRDGRVMYSTVKKQDADTIKVGGMPPHRFSDILTIDVRDRLIDGSAIGMIAGVAWGVASTHGHSKAVPIVRGALGGVIGAFIDYIVPGYERINVNQPAQLTLLPTATLHSIGFNGLLRW